VVLIPTNPKKKNELDYEESKKRITILVSDEIKAEWQEYVEKNKEKYTTISKLIRKAVNQFIKYDSLKTPGKTLSELTHDLREPLNAIRGNTHLIIEKYKDKLDWDILSKIKDVFDQSLILEQVIDNNLTIKKTEKDSIDILIIDDDPSTNKVLLELFKHKGHTAKAVVSGLDALELLKHTLPKIILLDVILPELNGFEICKLIKKDENLKDIPIYFISAVTKREVEEKMEETQADGYFLKPFDYPNFDNLDEILKK
jgi:CheY-like chemotaxis protein